MAEKRFLSITHLHIYAVINTIIKYRFSLDVKKKITLLDVGCGNGVMICTLAKELTKKYPGVEFEFYGLDVDDSAVQEKGYFEKMLEKLKATLPGVVWDRRVKLIGSKDRWPFPEDYFDIIYSNQVFEHVFDQRFTLNEIKRTMNKEAWSIHLYPLRHYIYEGHLLIPFVHKFRSWTSSYYWIKWASYLGIGTYRQHKHNGICNSVHEYAERHADYMAYEVNYQTTAQVATSVRESGLKLSFDFTYLYYKQKLRSLFKLSPIEVYKSSDLMSAKNSFYFFFLKYISGITLIVRKSNSYQ